MAEENRITDYDEFWAFYVGEHRSPFNRFLHYVGSSLGLGLIISALATQVWWLLALAPLFGYGNAWIGHFVVEKNKPASFKYPGWSFVSDFKMLGYALTGQMRHEVERLYGSQHPAPDAPCLVTFTT
jgi:hypothetical protein